MVTESVCPVCLRRIPAERVRTDDGKVYLEKTCPEHGRHRDILWKGLLDYEAWRGPEAERTDSEAPDCTHCRGLCAAHERGTCCTLLEITDRCDLYCRFCFADPEGSRDPSLAQVKSWIFDLTEPGETFLQLSGGEPTVRDDLPEIVSFAKKCGCRYIQLNSNGLRLAREEEYVRSLAEAGLSFVFLQFDGVTDDVFEYLRGRKMLDLKRQCIENCGRYGIGVTLVPTVVPGINDHQIGRILTFAASHSPVVRGVHFQPVSYFGRLPEIPGEDQRYTLDCLLTDMEEQTEGEVSADRIRPSCCDHPMCGLHGDFVVLPDRTLYPLTARSRCASASGDAAKKNREFIGKRWQRQQMPDGCGDEDENFDMTDMDTFLKRVKNYGFTVTSMAFQDAGNIDTERLRSCSLHVYRKGRRIPFCAAYLSPWN